MTYQEFISSKVTPDVPTGFEPPSLDYKRPLFPFQHAIVEWALRRGRAAIFADCGLGKTAMQIAWADKVVRHTNKPLLILAPLAVAEQTCGEARVLGVDAKHVRDGSEITGPGIYATNYEKLHRFNPTVFGGVVLDESSILKAFGGSTRKQVTEAFVSTQFKLCCTATPSPNDLIEITNHAEFLGVMSGKEIIALFFCQDGNTTHAWRLKGHASIPFWKWMAQWSIYIRQPSDIGFSDDGFTLPPLAVSNVIIQSTTPMEGYLIAMPASTLQERRVARRSTMTDRVAAAEGLIHAHNNPVVSWCNLNSESKSLTRAIDGAVELTGSQSEDEKEEILVGFSRGEFKRLVTKPVLAGFGLNWQHCAHQAFVGLSDSFEQYYQAVRRSWRFGQKSPVEVKVIIGDSETAVLQNIQRKQKQADAMAVSMREQMGRFETVTQQRRNVMDYNPETQIDLPKWI